MISFKQFLNEMYKKYSHSGEGFASHRDGKKEPWRGPHEGKELEMMHAGVKPAALVNDRVYHEKFKKHVDSGKFISKPLNTGAHEYDPSHIVGLKGEEYRVNKLHKEFSKTGRNHAKIGRLLGYSKEHIKKWLNRT